MAPRLLLALLLLSVVALCSGERGREIRRRVRSTSTTTTTPAPSESPADGEPVGDDKAICEGEPGCEWSCNSDHPDPNTRCMCACTAPEQPHGAAGADEQGPYDGSYFGK